MNTLNPSAKNAEAIKEKRARNRAIESINRIATMSWLLPLLAIGLAFTAAAIVNKHLVIIGIVNVCIVLYSSTCSIRTWVNYAELKRRDLFITALAGSIVNLSALAILGLAIAMILTSR
jgi:hypothetical protein